MSLTKSDLFHATAWYGLGNLVVRLVAFLLLPLYSNLIPVEQFGIYSLLMSTYAITTVFYQYGLNAALTNYYLKENDESKRRLVFSSILNFTVILGIGLTLLSILFSKQLSKLIIGTSEYQVLFVLMFVILLIESVSTIILQLFKTLEQSKRVVLYLFIGAIFNLVLNIFFVYFLRQGINGIVLAQLISSGLVLLILFPAVKFDYVFQINSPVLNPILIFAFPLFLSGLFSSGLDVADRYILDYFLGKKEVGEYSFAYRLALITNVFVISFRTAWIPYAIKRYQENNYHDNFGKTFLKLLTAGILILLTVTFFADDLFRINLLGKRLFNPDYQKGLIILPYVILGYIFSSIAAFYSVYPFVISKSIHFLISDAIGLIVNLILNFALIPMLGLIGAGISTCISFFTVAIYMYLISRGKIKLDYSIRDIVTITVSGVTFFIIGMLVNNFILQGIIVLTYLIFVKIIVGIKVSQIFRFVK